MTQGSQMNGKKTHPQLKRHKVKHTVSLSFQPISWLKLENAFMFSLLN